MTNNNTTKQDLSGLLSRIQQTQQREGNDAAIAVLDKALKKDEKNVILIYNRGILLRENSDRNCGFEEFLRANEIMPNWLDPILALNEIALAKECSLISQRNVRKLLFRQTLDCEAKALYLRGRWAERENSTDKAAQLYKEALSYDSNLLLALERLSSILLRSERWIEAEKQIRELIERGYATAINISNLSISLLKQKRLDEALEKANLALCHSEEKSLKASILVNLGSILQEQGDFKQAEKKYHEAIRLNDKHVNAFLNIGVVHFQRKEYLKAETYYRKAIKTDPDCIRAKVNLAGLLLLQGKFKEGWSLYEERLKGPTKILSIPDSIPRWDGGRFEGDLLIVHEQGLGDTFQFIRFAHVVEELYGINCHFQGPRKLHGILNNASIVKSCSSEEGKVPNTVARYIPTMSLPYILNSKETFTTKNYLKVDTHRKLKWENILGVTNKLRIALHWQGNPDHEYSISKGRSFKLKILSDLTEQIGVELLHLQKGEGSEQAIEGRFASSWHPKQPLIDSSWDFEDAAAILSCCDILISSDSGLAHLAGAIGCKVYLLLPRLAEWRWGLDSNFSYWYPNHTLFRQKDPKNWTEPVSKLLFQIKAIIAK